MILEAVAVCLVALALVAGLAGQADAANARRKRPQLSQHTKSYDSSTRGRSNPMAENGYNGYYERVLDRVPFGSQIWWRVYEGQPRGR